MKWKKIRAFKVAVSVSLWPHTVVQREDMLWKVFQEDVPGNVSNASWGAGVSGTRYGFLTVLIKSKNPAKIKGQLTKRAILRIISFKAPVPTLVLSALLLWLLKKPAMKQLCRTMLCVPGNCTSTVWGLRTTTLALLCLFFFQFPTLLPLEGILHASSLDLLTVITVYITTCCSQEDFKARPSQPAVRYKYAVVLRDVHDSQ